MDSKDSDSFHSPRRRKKWDIKEIEVEVCKLFMFSNFTVENTAAFNSGMFLNS